MATAHKVFVTVRNRRGQIKTYPYTTTDVNAAFLLAPSGGNQLVLSPDDAQIVDYVHSTQGTCTQVAVFFNNADTGIRLPTASCQPTVNRLVRSAPIDLPAGTLVKFQTLT